MKLWQLLLWLAGLVLLFGIGLLGFHTLLMPRLIHRHAEVRVPELLSRDLEEARDTAGAVGLRVEVVRREPHPTEPAGRIIDQRPLPGRTVRSGRVVAVTVSAGEPAGRLPSIVGLTPRQAAATLQREGYRIGRTARCPVEGVPAGVVALQSPAAGSSLPRGKAVDQLLSESPPPVAWLMPDLRGATLVVARAACRAARCVLAPVRYRRQRDVPVGTVLEQRPAPGERIREGDVVELVAATR